MKKVILTRDQATELEDMKKMNYTIEEWYRNKMNPIHPYSVIHDLSIDELAKVLYLPGGYEIEKSKFKAGDKVVTIWDENKSFYTLEEFYPEITNTKEGKGWKLVDLHFGIHEKHIRHATPEEIYWLETLGREKLFDFREGDAILDIHGDITPVNTEFQVNYAVSYFSNKTKNLKGVYPAESFKRYPQEDE